MQNANTQQEDRIKLLSCQSDAYIRRIQTFEDYFWALENGESTASSGQSIRTMNTAASYQSARESISSSYGRNPYANDLLSTSEESFKIACEVFNPCDEATTAIEDYLLRDIGPSLPALAAGEDKETYTNFSLETNWDPAESSESLLPMQYVLHFESGEIPALVSSIHMLCYLMARIKELDVAESISKFSSCHYFDCITGGISGAIPTILLGCLRMDVAACASIFSGSWIERMHVIQLDELNSNIVRAVAIEQPIIPEHAEQLAHEAPLAVSFGADLRQCQTLVFTNAMIRKSGDRNLKGKGVTALFKSYGRARRDDAATILTAATSYWGNDFVFGSDEYAVLDACVIDNAILSSKLSDTILMTMSHIGAMHKVHQEATRCSGQPPRLIVSLGSNHTYRFPKPRSWRTAYRQSYHLFPSRDDTEKGFNLPKSSYQQSDYYRFRAELGVIAGTYDISATISIAHIIRQTDKYLERPDIKRQMLEIAQRLVTRRQARAKEPGWARYAGLKPYQSEQ